MHCSEFSNTCNFEFFNLTLIILVSMKTCMPRINFGIWSATPIDICAICILFHHTQKGSSQKKMLLLVKKIYHLSLVLALAIDHLGNEIFKRRKERERILKSQQHVYGYTQRQQKGKGVSGRYG